MDWACPVRFEACLVRCCDGASVLIHKFTPLWNKNPNSSLDISQLLHKKYKLN